MKYIFTFPLLIFIVFTSYAQNQAETKEAKGPSFLPKNEADDYIVLEVSRQSNAINLQWKSKENTKGKTFHLLKGTINDERQIRWEILAAFEATKRKQKFEYVDKNPNLGEVYYRLRISEDREKVQYTRYYLISNGKKGRISDPL